MRAKCSRARGRQEFDWQAIYTARQTVSIRHGRQLQHLRIQRRDGKPITCGWDLLQRIKNETLGADVRMAEYYPPEDQVVNEINARHLWEIPEDVAAQIGSL